MKLRGRAPLQQGDLGGRHKSVRLTALDVCVILFNVVEGAKEPDVGFEDCNQTLNELLRYWNKPIWWERAKLESALWSCNMRAEKGRFWHPQDYTFDEWLKKIELNRLFNKKYNFLTDRED